MNNSIETIDGVATIKGLEGVFSSIVSLALGLGGIVLFFLLISGGFSYLTSGGDQKKIEGAKATLTSAIIGIIVLILAFLILKLIETLTGANVTQFQIKF
jgi:hypothetical protein